MKDYDKWGLWLVWVVLEMIGFALGTWLGQQLYARFEPALVPAPNMYLDTIMIRSPFLRDLFVGLGVGLCAGAAEWFILRTYFKVSIWWLVISIVSWAVAMSVSGLIYYAPAHDFGFAGLAIGFIIGVAQWSILRRTCAKAGWWIVARTAGGTFYFMLSGFSLAIASGIAAVFFITSSINATHNVAGIDQKARS